MHKDFKDLLSAFNARNVRYMIVGGYAYARYTEPRTTKDLDLFVRPDRKMHLPSFRPFYSIDGLTFDQAWETAELAFVDEVPVRYISCENLIVNKLAVARPQDLVDVDKLRHARETKRRHSTKSARQ